MTSRGRDVPSGEFMEPATYPPMESLTLKPPHYPWKVIVVTHKYRQYVTVFDVFAAV